MSKCLKQHRATKTSVEERSLPPVSSATQMGYGAIQRLAAAGNNKDALKLYYSAIKNYNHRASLNRMDGLKDLLHSIGHPDVNTEGWQELEVLKTSLTVNYVIDHYNHNKTLKQFDRRVYWINKYTFKDEPKERIQKAITHLDTKTEPMQLVWRAYLHKNGKLVKRDKQLAYDLIIKCQDEYPTLVPFLLKRWFGSKGKP